MKTRLLRLAALLWVSALLLHPTPSRAVTTTTLLSQDFSSATFPPAGWTIDYAGEYNYYYGGWYWSSGGKGGSNGSAVASDFYGYQPGCNYGNATIDMTTPTFNTSGLTPADSIYLDFDMWFPEGYYQVNLSPYQEDQVIVTSGTNTLLNKKSPGDCTFYTGSSLDEPSNYTAATYWTHYHVAVPGGSSTTSITFTVKDNGGYCYYGYMYVDNVAFDNVVVTKNHYDFINVVGPTLLNFGGQQVGFPTGVLYSKIQNQSARTVNLSNYNMTGSNPGDFSFVRKPTSIPAGGTDSVGIVFTPQAQGTRLGTANITTDADNIKNVAISLTGFGQVALISVPQNLTLFAKQHVRFRQTIMQSFLVSNTGPIPLTILPQPATFINGDNPSEYQIVRLPTSPILQNGRDSITVSFTATNEGAQGAVLNIASNAANGTPQIQMRGIGILPRLVINGANSPANNQITISFDSVNVGTQKCTQILFTNYGTDTLIIRKNFLSSRDYDFTITPFTGSDTALAPEVTKPMNVCFTPIRNGFRTATIRVATNIPVTFPVNPPVNPNTFGADTSSFSINLIGTGVPFGNLAITGPDSIGSPVKTQGCMADTMWNTGSADISVTAAAFFGLDSTEFSFTGLPAFPFVLSAGSSMPFSICGTPSVAGDRTTLFTASGTVGETKISSSFPVDVFGQSPCDSASVAKQFPALTCTCSAGDTAIFNISNCGDLAATYVATIVGANASDYSFIGASTSSLEAPHSGMATFTVAYHPTSRGTSTANLSVTGGPSPLVIPLMGKAGAPNITGTATAPATASGATSASFPVVVMNSGECPWTPGVPTLPPGSPFMYVSGGTTPIAPGQSANITFMFMPTADGTFNSTLAFPSESCAPQPAANVTITGTASSAGVATVTASMGYSIEQNHPNPFAGRTEVSITLPKESIVRLAIIDQTGQVVRSVMNQQMASGTYNVTIDAGDLASGTYYYQMTAGDVVLTRQMTIMK